MNRFNEDSGIRSEREVMTGKATFTKGETKSSGNEISIVHGINHAHRYQRMTPRNESIRRSITTRAAFRRTRAGHYRRAPSTFLIDAIIIYYPVPRSGASPEAMRTLQKKYTHRLDITSPRRSKNKFRWPERPCRS